MQSQALLRYTVFIMYICPNCKIFYQDQLNPCQKCRSPLKEVSLLEALKHTDKRFLCDSIKGKDTHELPDAHKQYHIRSYLGNRSLFLDYDIQKNRMKHGPKLKRFLICKIDMTAVFNIPWFFFNVFTSNLFHLQYTQYCPRCNTKYIKGQHTPEECDYNIEYFSILEDILNGTIVLHKPIYKHFAEQKRQKGWRTAYDDLFFRKTQAEAFWDIASITLSVLFWLFITVYVSWPFAKTAVLKLQHLDQYEFGFPIAEDY